MSQVIPLLDIPQPPMGCTSYNIPCPRCDKPGRRKGHLNINLKKNVFNCPRCSSARDRFGGGVLDFYSYFAGVPRAKAATELRKQLGLERKGTGARKRNENFSYQHQQHIEITSAPLADIDRRHAVYQAMLQKLGLAPDHLDNLKGRGLTELEIDRLGYRTTPVVGLHKIAEELMLDGFDLRGVPGFCRDDDGRWMAYIYRRGIMIPCRDLHGRIQRLHIRLDEETASGGKFLPFSSTDKRDGCKAENWCHVVGPPRESVLLIEGYMKADIVHAFTGQTLISVPGVNSINHLESTLLEMVQLGTRHVMTCFDMDYLKNWHVDSAYLDLLELLSRNHLSFGTYLWVPDYNGLDDYIWKFCFQKQPRK